MKCLLHCFNSILDLPSIISGDTLAFFEPQETIWEGESGQWFSLSDLDGSDNLKCSSGIANFNPPTRHYAKTLFRFPLRTRASGLSENIYTVEKLNELIDALRSEAKLLLLFLRSIQTIEVYNIDSRGRQSRTFQATIAESCLTSVSEKRRDLLTQLKSCHADVQYNFSSVIEFTAKFDISVYDRAVGNKPITSHWVVANQVGSANAAVREASVKQKVFPWVGTAVELDSPGDGRIFCFLPMPIETASNLPVHVNGTFGLNDDRRSLKWPGPERRNDTMANWNAMLIKDVLPSCYVKLLLEARDQLTPAKFYKAWPQVELLESNHWECVLTPIFASMFSSSVIWSHNYNQWVNPTKATYKPRTGELLSIVDTVLTACGVVLAEVPAHVWEAFDYSEPQIPVTEVTPAIVRENLRDCPNSYASINISNSDTKELLSYCLSDDPLCYNDLHNLNLLPLANGTFTAFHVTSIHVSTPECPTSLLPGLEHKLVDVTDDSDLHAKLVGVAQSGATQLKMLDASAVACLLDEVVPAKWRQTGYGVMPDSQIPSNWLEKFWEWAKKQQLSTFQNKFIFPVLCANNLPVSKQYNLVKLSSSQPILYFPSYCKCTKTLQSVMDQYNVRYCKEKSFPYLKDQDFQCFAKTYSSGSSALLEVIAHTDDYKSVSLTSQQAECLRNAILQIGQLSAKDKIVVKRLRIFSSCANTKSSGNLYSRLVERVHIFSSGTNNSSILCSIEEVAQKSLLKQVVLQPTSCIDVALLPSDMIILSSTDHCQTQLLMELGLSIPSGVQFLTEHVFPYVDKFNNDQRCKIMTSVLDKYYTLHDESSSISDSIRNLQFVSVASGVRKCPHELYDPSDSDLCRIFAGQDVFPTSPYDKSKYIEVLRSCGLRTSVQPQEILDVITSISKEPSALPQKVSEVQLRRARAVISYIKTQISSSVNCSLTSHGRVSFERGLEILCRERSWLPVLAKRPRNYPACLPWKGTGYTSHFISVGNYNSVCVSRTDFEPLALKYGSQAIFTETFDTVSFNEPLSCLVPHFKQVVACRKQLSPDDMLRIVQVIYSAMLQIVQGGTNTHYLNEIKSMKDWVYIKTNHKFLSIDCVAMTPNPGFRHTVEPYLHILPDSISKYSALFRHFGMSKEITRSQIVSVLTHITESSGFKDAESAWSMVMAILNWVTENGTKTVDDEHIYVPAEVKGTSSQWPLLKNPEDLVYPDNEFLKEFASTGESESDPQLMFVHSRVNQSLAKCLKITPLSEELDISEDTFEDAGQHEPLVVRLKNILRDYKDGLTIIKELLQNADDAEATEVNICFDARNHTTERKRLFFPDMCEAHGPALIVHNNCTFSDEDFENIQKLAGATKQGKHLKIGKFGVGFCSVYHITDVPSFVSRERLYIFDPTLQHLKKAVKNPAQPGKRVNYLTKVIQRSKQLEPYQGLFGFDSSSEYKGTMFRLPFRTTHSELSSTCYSSSTIKDLVKSIQECGDKLLLFLRHVRSITVQQISNGQSEPQVLFKLQRLPQEANPDRASLVLMNLHNYQDNTHTTNSWSVKSHSTTHQNKPAIASVACLLEPSKNSYTVNAKLEGESFCFLPLSQSTGLPVHISCNFAVINNRRGIWTSSTEHKPTLSSDTESSSPDTSLPPSDSEQEVEWNIYLMKSVIPQAYIELLVELKENGLIQDYSNTFYSLWPLGSNLEHKNPWEYFVAAFYSLLPHQSLFYSESTSKWLTMRESKFLDPYVLSQSGTPSCVVRVIHHLCLPLVHLPARYVSHLELSHVTITELKLVELFFNNLASLDSITSDRNAVVCLLLEAYGAQYDENTTLCQQLSQKFKSVACIPCGVDGEVLRECSEVVDRNATFANLFEDTSDRFPIKMLSECHLATSALRYAGMMHDTLSWELIADRAQSVASLMETDCLKALERIKLILSTMASTASDLPSNVCIDSIAFLPVMKKPEGYPLEWYGDKHKLLSGRQVIFSGSYGYDRSDTSFRIAGSQVAFVCEDLPEHGGCGYIGIERVKKMLHLRAVPNIAEVIAHFKLIIRRAQSGRLDSRWVSISCSKIYDYIEKTLSRESEMHDAESIITEELQDEACIWNGNVNIFLTVDQVALNWKLKKGPYLFTAPPDVASKERLSKLLEIKEDFTCTDAQKALEMMKTKFQDNPLDDEHSKLITEILSIFQQDFEDNELSMSGTLYLPDTKKILRKNAELVYNDAHWAPVEANWICVSRELSRDLAIGLGVKLVRSKLLDKFVSKKQAHFKGFGQHEDLTRRIQNIIRDYPFDITLLKELLQNADDAKAKKLYFILDKRTHRKESVLSEKWQQLQGPALLVWNDSIFTEADLKGIQELGLGSKRDRSETIGQYGIGFNVVYHLTDCPSFVTNGETLCVFDPHCQYVPEATPELPGGMYEDLEGFWQQFKDMSSAYLQTGLKNLPEELRGGSLFRLPIRHSQDMVEASKIVDPNNPGPHTPNGLDEFMRASMPDMKRAMFFLNNVVELKFLVIEQDDNSLQTRFHYRAEITQSTESKKSLQDTVKKFIKTSGCKSQVIMYPMTVTEVSAEAKEKNKQEKWLIQQGVGDINDEQQMWQFVKTAKPKHGIAASLDTLNSRETREKGQLFCFLPLPVKSDVPVHVNGSFVLDTSRRDLWKTSKPGEEDDRTRWNNRLFKAIASSYADFLVKARSHYLKSTYKNWTNALADLHTYYSLFPKFPVIDVKKKWDSLACYVYRFLLKHKSKVMCVMVHVADKKDTKVAVKWHPLMAESCESQVYFWSDSAKYRHIIHPILESIGMQVTSCPTGVMECFNRVIGQLNSKRSEEQSIPSNDLAMPTVTAPTEEWKKFLCISPSSVFAYYTKYSSFSSARNTHPRSISETVFISVDNFETFVKFLIGVSISPDKAPSSGIIQSVTTQRAKVSSNYLSHVSSGEATLPSTPCKFPSSPFSHYLLLTADGYLRQFDEVNKVFNCRQEHLQLFPKHLDKFLGPTLRKLRLESSYFIQPAAVKPGDEHDDEDTARIVKLINDIFADSFPQAMHNAHVVLNASATFPQEELKKYWSMFSEDQVFAHFLPDFLKHWALLLTTDDRLYSYSSNIIPVYKHFHEEERGTLSNELARAVMESLKMPFLDFSVVVASVNCPCLSNRDQVLSNMFHLNAQTPLLDAITTERINFLIDYFSVNTKPSDSKWVMHIKSLPFFEDIAGNYKSLSEYTKAFVWPYSASNVGYDSWITRDAVFLKEDAKWNKLGSASQLSIETISTERVYINYIFPNFGEMSEDERYQQLEHIRTQFTSIKYYSTLEKRDGMDESNRKRKNDSNAFIRDLKALECIGPDNSILQPVRYFCDPTVVLFHVFPSKFHILPDNFRTKGWLDFFKELGLKAKLTTLEYLDLCNETAESDKVDEECMKKSDTLLKYMFKTEVKKEWCDKVRFLRKVSDIPFVYTVSNSSVEWIAPAACEAKKLVKLNKSAVTSVRNLLWTVRPIIRFPSSCFISFPPYGDPNGLSILKTLNVSYRDNLEASDVVENVQNISRSQYATDRLFSNFPAELKPASDIRTSLLEIMLSNFESLKRCDASAIKPLSDCRCIPVYCDLLDKEEKKMVLVKPSHVLFSKQEVEGFHPYLHEAPTEFRYYMTVLETIGVKQTLGGQHIQIVLEALHDKYRGAPLDPNAKHCVKVVLTKLQTLLQLSSASSSNLDFQLSPLYLPDVGDVLKNSSTMLYGDIPAFYHKMSLNLADTPYAYFHINKSLYSMDALHLCGLLPAAVSPLPLSSKCRFDICDECEELEEPTGLARSVQKSVKYEENPLVVCELVTKFISTTLSDDRQLLKSVEELFSSLQIKTISALETTIVLKDCDKPIGREKSEFFFSEDVLYIDSEFEGIHYIYKSIVGHLYKTLPSSLTETIPLNMQPELLETIIKYLEADAPSKKKKVLEKMGCEGVSKPARNFQLTLGEEIPDNYLHRLDQSAHNVFHPNEKVGYEEKEGCIKVAQVLYLDNPGAEQLDKIYCIIVSEESAAEKKVSILKLYKFITTSELSAVDSSEVVRASGSDSDRDSDTDLSEIKDRVLEQLRDAWRLEPSERNTAVRRLYLKWHPDKNLDNLETAKEVFQFLQDQIKLLESEDDDSDEGLEGATPRSGSGVSASYPRWNQTASAHRDASNWEREHRRSNPHTTSSFDNAREEPNPEEGRRWVRQAEVDFKVLCDIHCNASNSKGYCHVCFMAHQVAEKALKGGMYAKCGVSRVSLANHNLTSYSYALQTVTAQASDLPRHSAPLEDHYLKPRYPNRWGSGAPYEHYTPDDADSAKEHAEALLDIIRDILSQ